MRGPLGPTVPIERFGLISVSAMCARIQTGIASKRSKAEVGRADGACIYTTDVMGASGLGALPTLSAPGWLSG